MTNVHPQSMRATEGDVGADVERREVKRLVDIAADAGQADTYAGQRNWTRYALGMAIDIAPDPQSPDRYWTAELHNLSGGGFGFWSKHQLSTGGRALVRERAENGLGAWLTVQIKHCTAGVRGFLIGAAFDAAAPPDNHCEDKQGSEEDVQAAESLPDPQFRPIATLQKIQSKCALLSAVTTGIVAAAATILVASQADGLSSSLPWFLIGSAMVLGGCGGALMVRREARFLDALQKAVQRLARGKPHTTPIPDPPSRELGVAHNAIVQLYAGLRRRANEERVQRQKLEEVTRIKSNILAIVSHDLRTPLTSILLYAQMLSEEMTTLPDEDKRRFLQIVTDECNRLSRLLDDLLEVQRLESGQAMWDMKTHDLTQVIGKCAGVFQALASSKKIDFTIDCPETLPPVEADSDKMSQVVSNLLSNALKYTPADGKVAITARPRGKEILISVADNGPGIPREKWDHIFDRFSQLADPNVSQIVGFGLGLSIVKRIVEAHGGAVWCDSELGAGSIFHVSLPVSEQPHRVCAPADDSNEHVVLVCDADPELAATIAQTLRNEKLEVRVVHSGCRLLTALDLGDVEVVITDVLLPDMNAGDLLDALGAKPNRGFKLIVHSYAGEGRDLIRRYGADIFLKRPVSKDELVHAVQTAISHGNSDGRTVVIVQDGGLAIAPLTSVLTDAGHLPLVAESIQQAAEMTQNYATDAVLVPIELLDSEWSQLEPLAPECEDGPQVVVLAKSVRRRERVLAERCGVFLASMGPLETDELLAAVAAPKPMLVGG